MSSVRNLKKSVNSMSEELMIDSFTFGVLFPDKSREELSTVISSIFTFRTNTLNAINSVSNESLEPIRKQYQNIVIKIEAELSQIIESMQKLHD